MPSILQTASRHMEQHQHNFSISITSEQRLTRGHYYIHMLQHQHNFFISIARELWTTKGHHYIRIVTTHLFQSDDDCDDYSKEDGDVMLTGPIRSYLCTLFIASTSDNKAHDHMGFGVRCL